MSDPRRGKREVLRTVFYLLAMALMLAYILNPGFGFIELIPDNVPVFGNLDEAGAAGALLYLWNRWRGRGGPKPEVRDVDASVEDP